MPRRCLPVQGREVFRALLVPRAAASPKPRCIQCRNNGALVSPCTSQDRGVGDVVPTETVRRRRSSAMWLSQACKPASGGVCGEQGVR